MLGVTKYFIKNRSCFYTFWILLTSWLVCSGWVLSALRELNAVGYLASLLLFGGLFIWWMRCCGSSLQGVRAGLFTRLRRRFRRPLPFIYLLLLVLILMGDLLYAPTQYDGLCYRVPRMLHWLSEGHWHWIHSGDNRLNISAVNHEWMTLPLLAILRSDRWFWIPNLISFALLPGLIFGMFRELGVTPRAAWSWMWLLPAGFCFVTQAGSIGNDLTAVPFALASVYFAMRARRGCYRDLVLAVLSVAMITGIKGSNIPLVLPALVAAIPALHLLRRKPFTSLTVLLVAVMVSFLPTALSNQLHTGHWSGDRENLSGMRITSPSAGLLGNGIMLTEGAFQPPVLQQKGMATALVTRCLGEKRLKALKEAFPRFNSSLDEIPIEEASGLGMGVTFALLAGIILQFRAPRGMPAGNLFSKIVLLSGGIALGGYMIKMGSESASRLLMPYYPIVLAGFWVLLVRLQNVVRLSAWRWFACLGALMAVPVLILSPARPLWPALTILGRLDSKARFPLLQRAVQVYTTYRGRHDALGAIRDSLPAGVQIIGLVDGGGDLESGLWWPLGSRRVMHLLPNESPNDVRASGVQVLCASERVLKDCWGIKSEEFSTRYNGSVIAHAKATQTVAWGEEEWVIVYLRNPPVVSQ